MKSKVIWLVSFALSLTVFIVSLINIIQYFTERNTAKELYKDIASQAVTVAQPQQQEQVLSVDFETLKKEYKDIVGWIYSPDTKINYPVVKSADNNEYLKLMPNGKYNSSGSIFVDFRNEDFGIDRNYIIYGHNMKNDSMFGSLSEYKKQKFYDSHPVIYYATEQKVYTLEVYAGFVTVSDSDSYTITHTEESLAEYMKKAKEKSTFKSETVYNTSDNIVTLSTCSSDYDNARYVLIAIVKE